VLGSPFFGNRSRPENIKINKEHLSSFFIDCGNPIFIIYYMCAINHDIDDIPL
jgi:hypothetical protein